jgi:ferredoxin
MEYSAKPPNRKLRTMPKHLILCDCLKSQSIDAKLVSEQCGVECSRVYTNLCGAEIAQAAKEIQNGDVIIACLQEQAVFEELAEETKAPVPAFLDIRDRAGWSDEGTSPGPKMAALINDALLPSPPVKMLDIQSDGRCLILGASDVVLDAADRLSEVLSVTALLCDTPDMLSTRHFDVVKGRVRKATGSLGAFAVEIDGLCQLITGGRGGLSLGEPRKGGRTDCDIIIDLSGGISLFSASHARDGYLRADPRDALAVSQTIFAASQLVGGFEKPLYVQNNTHLCAHSRAEIIGCTACIDNCSSSAIRPDGEHVKIDPNICDGCGDCVALCPSGALEFDAPATSHLFKRIQTLAESFSSAGGREPKLLVCDADYGSEMISLAARFGRGLPGDVIPLELENTALFGHAEMLAALAVGFARVDILLDPKTEASTQTSQAVLARAISSDGSVRLLEPGDPDALCDVLYGAPSSLAHSAPILTQGGRRQVARLAAKALHGNITDPIALPSGAPYGKVEVNTDSCTLCLSCVSLCPSGALSDNPDSPQLRFVEDACLQCGLCTRLCPEKALTLVPQFDLSDAALSPVTLHEEEPFACISCGGLFGVKSTVEKITSLLAGKHSMFETSEAGKLIQMCDNCRIEAQYHSENVPFQGADRPPVITTEDYFSKRKDH